MFKSVSYFLFLSMLILFSSSCSKGKKGDQQQVEQKTKKVAIATASYDSVQVSREFSANIEAYVTNNIVPQTPNRISRILVNVGDYVRKGQLLVTLDEANLTQNKLQLQNLEAEFKRIDDLYAIGGISKSQWESRKTALDVSKTAYANLLQNTMLTAPTNGVVTARNYDPGDMVSLANPILVVEQITPLKMHTNISAQYFNSIKKELPVKVSVDLFPQEVFEAKVALTYPTIDSRTHTFETEIELPNIDKRLRPGMYAKASIDMGMQRVLLVPDIAVRTLAGTTNHYVFVVADGIAHQQNIEVGSLYGDKYEVLSGLNEGDKIVVAGLLNLKDGDQVSTQE